MRFLLFLIKVILAIALGFLAYFFYYFYEERGNQEISLIIRKGSSIHQISSQLQDHNLISRKWPFVLVARGYTLKKDYLQAGEYKFAQSTTAMSVLKKLLDGDRVVRKVTIPEGYTLYQIMEVIEDSKGLAGDISLNVEEGWLLPETYLYSWGDTKDSVVVRMQKDMRELVDEHWEKRPEDYHLKTKQEAITLASIVERETKLDSERAKIAGVYLNRLKKGMLLQADPTVVYAVSNGTAEFGRKVRYKDLDIKSKYNTYKYKGLPPGPIANPGKASVIATLNPEKTDDLYFVANGEGGHFFARTSKEHKKNVAKYKKSEYYRINR